jgi:hypothetical protein
LRVEEYGDGIVGKCVDELADKLVAKGLEDKDNFVQTLFTLNRAVQLRQQEHPLINEILWSRTVLSTQLPLPCRLPNFSSWRLRCSPLRLEDWQLFNPDTAATVLSGTIDSLSMGYWEDCSIRTIREVLGCWLGLS